MEDREWFIEFYKDKTLDEIMKNPPKYITTILGENIPIKVEIEKRLIRDREGMTIIFPTLSVTIMSDIGISVENFEADLYKLFSKYENIYEGIKSINMKYEGKEGVPVYIIRFDGSTVVDMVKRRLDIESFRSGSSALEFKGGNLEDIESKIFNIIRGYGNITSTSTVYRFYFVSVKTSYISKLRHDKDLSDLTIYIGDIPFYVHKAILYSASTYFSNLQLDSTIKEIQLNDIDKNVFSLFLDFIYGVRVSSENPYIMDLLNMVLAFDVDNLDWIDIILSIKNSKYKPQLLELIKLIYPTDQIPDLISTHIKEL